jgi:hypothetical protein
VPLKLPASEQAYRRERSRRTGGRDPREDNRG